MYFKTNALVLKTTRSYNNDVYLTLFTEHGGKMSVLASFAKSSKSVFAACSKPFVIGEFVVNTKLKTPKLIACDLESSNFRITDDLDKLSYGNYFLEVCHLTTYENIIDMKHYKLITSLISELSEVEVAFLPLMRLTYLVKLMKITGHGANLAPQCGQCGQVADTYWFDIREGQLKCGHCNPSKQGFKMKSDWVQLLKYIETKPMAILKSTKIHPGYMKPLIEIYEAFLKYHFQIKTIHSQSFIDMIL